MTRLLKPIVVGVVVLTWIAINHAEQPQAADVAEVDPQSTVCTYTFGTASFNWCVTDNGNIVSLQSPAGFDHIRNTLGSPCEGYVVTTGPFVDSPSYWDQAGCGASGWGTTMLIAGPSATAVTLQRTTLDGRFTLTQKIQGNKTTRVITVTQTVRNNGESIFVCLIRSADIDVDGRVNNHWVKSRYSVWASDINGVTINALTFAKAPEAWASQARAPINCTPSESYGSPSADYGAFVRYKVASLGSGKALTGALTYQVH